MAVNKYLQLIKEVSQSCCLWPWQPQFQCPPSQSHWLWIVFLVSVIGFRAIPLSHQQVFLAASRALHGHFHWIWTTLARKHRVTSGHTQKLTTNHERGRSNQLHEEKNMVNKNTCYNNQFMVLFNDAVVTGTCELVAYLMCTFKGQSLRDVQISEFLSFLCCDNNRKF